MRETFIRILTTLLGLDTHVDSGDVANLHARIEDLENAAVFRHTALTKIQEIISVLVATNPHIKVAGLVGQDEQQTAAHISGSNDPDRILN